MLHPPYFMKLVAVMISFLLQMEKKGLKLPKIDEVRKKARVIDGAKNVTLKEEDIEQVEMQSPISDLVVIIHCV